MYYIEKAKLSELFAKLSETSSVYLPVRKNGQVDFAKWEDGTEYCSDELKTVKSAKDLFFPQSENIVSFTRENTKITVEPKELPSERTVLFGVRACDAKSFDVLDKVFMSEPADSFYTARRTNGVVITTACSQPEETCFCSTFGIDPANPGADVQTWFVGEKLYWEALSEKGKQLTEEISALLCDADASEVESEKANICDIMKKLPLSGLSLEKFGAGKTKELFDAPEWEKLSQSCLGCGACTFVCPTCQCYDIRDYDTGHGVKRYRCWDSCMYNDFTMCAHGTNRPTQLQRFRQRFMHKLVYFPDNNGGEFSCVGCGRCVSRCPISMNIAKVIKAFGGDNQ
ncbi:MAG: 4Fe-4S dicluster domain-containing protein [Acutalibacteraceae bacterium]